MVASTRPSPSKHLSEGRREAHLLHQGGDHRGAGAQHDRAEHSPPTASSAPQPVGRQQGRQGRASSSAQHDPQAPPAVPTLLGRLSLRPPIKEHAG